LARGLRVALDFDLDLDRRRDNRLEVHFRAADRFGQRHAHGGGPETGGAAIAGISSGRSFGSKDVVSQP